MTKFLVVMAMIPLMVVVVIILSMVVMEMTPIFLNT